MDMLTSMGIALVIAAAKELIKNPEKKEILRKAFLKVYQQIKLAYSDDPDFQ